MDKSDLKAVIQKAFSGVEYPGDWCLCGSSEGTEPRLVEQEFKGKDDWRVIDPAFLDRAPDGYASALSFFSDEAFHFYLPAYLISDIDGQLQVSQPVFHLTYGLDDDSRNERVNPRRYGERTWFETSRYKFSMFNKAEAAAIVAYLAFKRDSEDVVDFQKRHIDQAIRNYWKERAG
jgi:hypothetical protein